MDESASRHHHHRRHHCRHDDDDDDDDEIEDVDEANVMRAVDYVEDGLSDFENRDTPIISGRDTPSSHSHDDLLNVSSSRNSAQHPSAGGGGTSAGNNNNSNNNKGTGNAACGGGGMGSQTVAGNSLSYSLHGGQVNGLSGGNVQGGGGRSLSQLPVTSQKPNREDINEKFCKFEINKSNLNLNRN